MNSYIDSTLLKADATIDDITNLCQEAIKYNFASVCISPYYVSLAKELLSDSNVSVCTVIGFPLGFQTSQIKLYETIEALENGADEIDMVINIGTLKDKEYDYIKHEIEQIRNVLNGKILKVIIETGILTKNEIIKMTEICNELFVNFIKTSTGYRKDDNLIENIKIINKYKNDTLDIKASGNIKTYKQVCELIDLNVSRIGTSHAKEIMENETI